LTVITSSPFVKTLLWRDDLSPEDMAALEEVVGRSRNFAASDELIRQGSRPEESCLILSGLAGRSHSLKDGGRQFSAIHIPGDFVDLHAMLLKVMDHSVVALTPCRAAFFTHRSLQSAGERAPHVARMLWMLTVIDAAIHRAWIVSLGRRSAEAHVAHFFCELLMRLQIVDLVRQNAFEFPVRQSDLADMVGFSIVHLNRSIQGLRRKGLIEWKGQTVRIPDPDALMSFADFDPEYLSLTKQAR
jgi:CRP-like cAMP-binding protein